MHQTYLFLFTPECGMDLRQAAEFIYYDYAERRCDENNWGEFMAVFAGNGQTVIAPEFADHFRKEYGETLPGVNQIPEFALKELAADFELSVPQGEDIAAFIHQRVSASLGELYSLAAGDSTCNDQRSRLSATYEMFCDCAIKPFSRTIRTPYDYQFYELRDECWFRESTVIRPQDAVLFMDIHT